MSAKNCTKRKGIGFIITNGFTYIAVLVFIAALLVWLQRYTKSKFFDYAPPIVLLYLITMILCTLGAWDMEATKPAYSVLKNNLLYAMIFLMLLRCDIRKIIKLGPKMLGGFFAASVSISVAFIATFWCCWQRSSIWICSPAVLHLWQTSAVPHPLPFWPVPTAALWCLLAF